ncbi:DivIVA domain-containing protein [Micromonospora sagamiensis]|uniref:DivIVA domain-containing protein n=1 Tax=Micromonospora sagamiensis TaxID=47875 RepID=UPI001E5E52E4|nr:DivIVA domain-containing protein [Micromonospora sagamiensis]
MAIGRHAIVTVRQSPAQPVRPGGGRPRGTAYRSGAVGPLRPWQVRDRLFTPRGRHGVDATEVRAFLDRVADDLTALYAEVARTHAEAERIRTALREWQTEVARRELAGAR